ncbi:AAA family ATPase, partial [Sabulicella glaciei]|nr:AAA family ATPase [Roseococcus sp. MDT2-1-1]
MTEGTVHPAPVPEEGETEAEAERRRLSATLTGLRIAGFKSFAEPVQVPVLPGLTGVVGPNGCGKSNVVEALRWAMGESSARSLRGGEMDDVIFAGTATRPARNLAEVTLSLEDAEGVGPAPHDKAPQLEVIRRIERGSGSAYRVNGREVRARDVLTMFADLASGPRSSGMVSQGRVAALIGAKPEERRSVLEEAAGIAGLRARRHEAELKLRQAEANLGRSEDLLAQLAQQGDSLRKQARQAARYRNLNDLVRNAEAEWFALLVARAEAALESARTTLAEREATLRRAEIEAAAAIVAAERAEAALHDPRAEEGLARALLERRRVEAEGLAAEAERARLALEEAEVALLALREDAADATRLEQDAAAAGTRAQREEAGLAGALATLPARLEAAEAEAARLAEASATAEGRLHERTEAAAALAAQANALAAELGLAESRAARARTRRAEAEAALSRAEADAVPEAALEEASTATATAEETLARCRAALEAAERRRAEAGERAAEALRLARAAETERGAAERARAAATQRRSALEARARALEAEAARLPVAEPPEPAERDAALAAEARAEAEARLAAAEAARDAAARESRAAREAAEAARAVLSRLAAECEGLRAATQGGSEAEPIARTLSVPAGLEAALGAALGEGLEGGRGQGNRFWRALPPLEDAPPLPPGAQPLAALVEAPPELSRALGQIGLVEDGAATQAALRPGQALVSRDGALWRWDGFVLAPGAAASGAARLQALTRLRQAEARRAAAAPEAEGAESRRAEAASREAEALREAD